MNKIKIAIVGYGNVGRAAQEAVAAADDMELVGIVRKNASADEQKSHIPLTNDITTLGQVDVAILCAPSRTIPDLADGILRQGISTVDSYDIHETIFDLRTRLDAVAKEANRVAVIAAGWDPGSNSVIRAWLEAMAPKGLTYTNFGPGMSMGHTVAAKAIPGVKDALSITIPLGNGLHRRMVYIEPVPGADFQEITKNLKADPYFSSSETHAIPVEDVSVLMDRGHAAHLQRKGVSSTADNQLFSFNMTINNPALTGQIMVSAARAAMRQASGCYTLPEIPAIDLLPGDREQIIRRLV
jgi:diaminopimelate dehydrogenase